MFDKGDSSNDETDSTSERSLLSASSTANFEMVFVLTQENAFSQGFRFKANRKRIGFSAKRYILGIFKIAYRLRDQHVFI